MGGSHRSGNPFSAMEAILVICAFVNFICGYHSNRGVWPLKGSFFQKQSYHDLLGISQSPPILIERACQSFSCQGIDDISQTVHSDQSPYS